MSNHTTAIVAGFQLVSIMSIAGMYTIQYLEKTPSRTSKLTGSQYVNEILNSRNQNRVRRILRMSPDTFALLCSKFRTKDLLEDTRTGITVERQIMQFLHLLGGMTVDQVAERFQCSSNVSLSRLDSQFPFSSRFNCAV